MILKRQKYNLIAKARKQYGDIYFCGQQKDWGGCFSIVGDDLIFWFNDKHKTTHALKEPLRVRRETWFEKLEDWIEDRINNFKQQLRNIGR